MNEEISKVEELPFKPELFKDCQPDEATKKLINDFETGQYGMPSPTAKSKLRLRAVFTEKPEKLDRGLETQKGFSYKYETGNVITKNGDKKEVILKFMLMP